MLNNIKKYFFLLIVAVNLTYPMMQPAETSDIIVSQKTQLLRAAETGDLQTVSTLIASKVPVEIQGKHGFTPLHLAARGGYVAIIEKLLDAGANIQAGNKNGNTPLHAAAYGNHPAAIKTLVARGALLEARNNDGDTPLHSAAWKNNAAAIEALVAAGAALEARNKDGDTPLHLAHWNNSTTAIEALTALGAKVDAQNNDGETPVDLTKKKAQALRSETLAHSNHFLTSMAKAQELAKRINEKSESLKKILSDYQTYDVSEYEIERSIRTLQSLYENSQYLNVDGMIDSVAIMLPSNLPLYSFVVFALIPSLLSKMVNVRPNALLQEHNIISRIYDELGIENLFPGVHVLNTDHAGFKQPIKDANLVVFTGNPTNAEAIVQNMKIGSMLALNGSGHNPVVVTESANIPQAVEGTLLVKGFNGGQDCAGPDAILVHQKVANEFIEQFNKKFASLPVGRFNDTNTTVGPINRFTELQKFAQVFHNNNKDILSGGIIDFKNSIVFPTTIVRGIERYPNYKEMFGPVAFIHPYNTDRDLAYYFQDPDGQYNANRMYVTVYGHSNYVSARDDAQNPNNPGNIGIVLSNQTIHDVEIGYKPYGGYSLGASGIIKKTATGLQKVAMPILIPEIISEYIIKGKALPINEKIKSIVSTAAIASMRKDKEIDPIINSFQEMATEAFGSNLLFGFIFGSAAKGKLRVQGPDRDDLDTFICLKYDDKAAIAEYMKRLAALHHQYNLKVDDVFPAEIMTLKTLQETINNLDKIVINVDKTVAGDEFDHIFWIHALTDKKVGFIGDGKLMASLIKASQPYIFKWRDQILEQLQHRDILPENVTRTCPGLNKQETIDKLSRYSPHLVIHLGLNYDENEKTKESSRE